MDFPTLEPRASEAPTVEPSNGPSNNPRGRPDAGKAKPYVTRTSKVRMVRLDPSSEHALTFSRQVLALNDQPVSISTIVRVALQDYLQRVHLLRLRHDGIESEKARLRHQVRIPRRRRKRQGSAVSNQ